MTQFPPQFCLEGKQERGKQKIIFFLILGGHDQHIQKVHKALLYEVGNQRLISSLSRNMKLRKRTQPNPLKDTSFLIKLHPIPSPLEVTTVMTPNNHFLAFSLWFSTIGIGISLKIIVKLLAFALYKWNYTVYRGFVSHLSVDTM